MKTLAGSVAVGHIAQLEDELSQTRAERDNASALCTAARAVANAAEDKADNLEAMVERLEERDEQWVEAAHNFKVYRDELWAERDKATRRINMLEHNLRLFEKLAQDRIAERDDARRHACRLMWERDEAQTAFLEMMALAEDANDSLGEAVVLLEKVLESSDKLDAAKWLFGLRLQQGTKAIRARIEKETYDPHEVATIGYGVDRGGDGD